MKILLMVPITSFVIDPPRVPDLGLGYIASSLLRAGHDVSIRDWSMDPSPDDFKAWLREKKPEIIGIKVFTKDVAAAKKTISIIRETAEQSKIIIGGPHPSAVDPNELLSDFDETDFAMRGEAEDNFLLFVHAVKNGGNSEQLGRVPGLIWRDEANICSNPPTFIQDIDALDFPSWDLLWNNNLTSNMLSAPSMQLHAAPIITTRGCPGKCSFCCAYRINGKKIRYRSPDNILNEMEMLYSKYSVRRFMFHDNCFTSDMKHLTNICKGIVERGMNIEWDFVSYERLNNLTEETLSLIYQAGGRMIHMGIESGCDKTRKTMNKSCSLTEINEKIPLIKKSGVKVAAWFLLGFPGETRADMDETIRYAFSLKVDLMTFTICFPLPGSQVYSYIQHKHGFKTIDWASFDIANSPYPVSEMSSHELRRLVRIARVKLRIREIAKKVKNRAARFFS